jgi:hypothetical protein
MWATDKQIGFIHALCRELGRKPACDPSRLTVADASMQIAQLLDEQTRKKPKRRDKLQSRSRSSWRRW